MALKLYQEDVIGIFSKSIKITKVYLGNNLIKGEIILLTPHLTYDPSFAVFRFRADEGFEEKINRIYKIVLNDKYVLNAIDIVGYEKYPNYYSLSLEGKIRDVMGLDKYIKSDDAKIYAILK